MSQLTRAISLAISPNPIHTPPHPPSLAQQAYEALTLASRERSKLRQALLETEQEVTSNRQHMMHFYSGLAEIHNVMGEVEDELDNILAEQGEEGIGGGDDGADDPMTSLLGYGRAMLQPNKEEEEAATVEVCTVECGSGE